MARPPPPARRDRLGSIATPSFSRGAAITASASTRTDRRGSGCWARAGSDCRLHADGRDRINRRQTQEGVTRWGRCSASSRSSPFRRTSLRTVRDETFSSALRSPGVFREGPLARKISRRYAIEVWLLAAAAAAIVATSPMPFVSGGMLLGPDHRCIGGFREGVGRCSSSRRRAHDDPRGRDWAAGWSSWGNRGAARSVSDSVCSRRVRRAELGGPPRAVSDALEPCGQG
jgi:hypothetical protein